MRRRIGALLLFVAVGALCWLGAEFAVAKLGLLEYPPAMSRGHPTRGYTLRAGFEGESAFGIPFSVSAQGFRSPAVEIPKPAGARRVLVLGDSVAWGAGVREEETFSRQLEAMLRGELACPVDVVNAGVSGYGSIEELDVLQHEGIAFEPDVLIVYHVENDNQVVAHARGGLASFVKDHVVYRSYLVGATLYAFRNARWRVEAARAGGDRAAYAAQQTAWDQRPGTQASLEALIEIARIARERGVLAILASHPSSPADLSLDAVRNERLAELAGVHGMTFLDVGPALASHRDASLAVSAVDLHPNGFAHGLIAAALEPVVREALDCAPRAGAVG